MKTIKIDLLKNLSFLFIFLFGIYPFLPEKQEKFSVILLVFFSVVYYFKNGTRFTFDKIFLISSSVFLVFFVSFIFSENRGLAFQRISTMFSLIVIPFCFFILLKKPIKHKIKLKNLLFKIFFISNIIFCFSSFYAYLIYENPRYPTKDANFYRNAMQDVLPFGDHPTYISIFLSIAILFGLSLLNVQKNKLKNSLILIGLSVLLVNLFLLMSKGVITAFIISTIIISILFYKIKTKWVFLALTLISFSLLLFTPSENNRFLEILNPKTYETIDVNNSTSTRAGILICSAQLISRSPLFGYGLGDVKSNLIECYRERGYNFVKNYNSHNQYLFVWLTSGLIALLVFLYWLFFFFKKALSHKDYIFLGILIIYTISFLFENVLSRQSGVILFSFIVNFLLYTNVNDSNC